MARVMKKMGDGRVWVELTADEMGVVDGVCAGLSFPPTKDERRNAVITALVSAEGAARLLSGEMPERYLAK
jgi:hypothetical protein